MTSHLKIRQTVRRKKEAELEKAEEAIWPGSSCSVGRGLYEEFAVGDIHAFPMETSTLDEIQP